MKRQVLAELASRYMQDMPALSDMFTGEQRRVIGRHLAQFGGRVARRVERLAKEALKR